MKKIISIVLLTVMLSVSALGMFTSAGASGNDAISLWFDHATAKVKPTDTQTTGLDTYTVYLAKNDIQGAHFILYSEEDAKGLTASLTDFTNGSYSMKTELFYEIYAHAADDTPDAIPPLTKPFDLTGGKSKAFYFKAFSTVETPAGDYTAALTIKNAAGETVKTAQITAHVWDFALTEATSLRTAVYLGSTELSNHLDSFSNNTVYKQYYDYLLENRICAFTLPSAPYKTAGQVYMNNPRVTSVKLTGDFAYFSNIEEQSVIDYLHRVLDKPENASWFEKTYFYLADEPQAYMRGWSGDTVFTVEKRSKAAAEAFPGVRYIVPFHENFPVQYVEKETGKTVTMDAVEYFLKNDIISIWCTKPYAYMDNKYLKLLPGTRTLNWILAYEGNRDGFKIPADSDWDAQYGQFIDRIKPYVAEKNGDVQEWWYCAGSNGDSGTPNVLITDTGIASVMLGWQMKKYDIEGWLYYYCNNWTLHDEYQKLDKGDNGKIGDGILLYPGDVIGLNDTVVGSIRLECLRDGIEDALMLDMYESLTSTEQMQTLISRVAKNVVQYTDDDGEFAATRIYLGNEIERLTKGETGCDHEYDTLVVTAPELYKNGKTAHTCAKCGDVYFEIVDPLTPLSGDVTGDLKITSKDLRLIKLYIAGLADETDMYAELADFDNDGDVDMADVLAIKYYLIG